MTKPIPLSPAAWAVYFAASRAKYRFTSPIAAALQAVADQGEYFYDPDDGKVPAVRVEWLLAIAAELDGVEL